MAHPSGDAASLLEAVDAGDIDLVREIVSADPATAGADDDNGVSAIMHALYRARRDIADVLVDAGAPLGTFELCVLGDIDDVRRHFDDVPDAVAEWSADGYTPLHMACFFGREDIVGFLIDRGVDVNSAARNESGVRPVHSAVAARRLSVVNALLDAGADPDVQQHGGWTPLHSAAKHGEVEMTQLLLDHGADPSTAAEDGSTALKFAAEEGHEAVIAVLEHAIMRR